MGIVSSPDILDNICNHKSNEGSILQRAWSCIEDSAEYIYHAIKYWHPFPLPMPVNPFPEPIPIDPIPLPVP